MFVNIDDTIILFPNRNSIGSYISTHAHLFSRPRRKPAAHILIWETPFSLSRNKSLQPSQLYSHMGARFKAMTPNMALLAFQTPAPLLVTYTLSKPIVIFPLWSSESVRISVLVAANNQRLVII